MNDYQNLTWEEIGKRFAETEQLIKENAIQMKASEERLDRLGKYLGGVSNSNEDMAEEYFYNTLRRDKTFVNEKFDKISRNLTYRGEDDDLEMECDIFLFNGKSAAMIEVKYNAKPDNVNINELDARVKKFKTLYPEYKNHNIYLGIAAMSFKKGFAKRLHSAGIATIRPVGNKIVVYDKEVKVF
jgi:hypothetical protein